MNEALGNVGTTVTYGPEVEVEPGRPARLARASSTRAMDAGEVEVLVILGGNPVFTAPADLQFAENAREGAASSRITALYVDETSHLCHWNLPEAHALESWGDARAYDGTVTLMQPLIAPLYEGRSPHEVLALFTQQADRRGMQIVKDYWTRAHAGGRRLVDPARRDRRRVRGGSGSRALHDGFIPGTGVTAGRARDGRLPRRDHRSPTCRPPPAAPADAQRRPRDHLPSRSRRSGTAASPTTAGCRNCRSR